MYPSNPSRFYYFQLYLRPWNRESKHRQHPRHDPRLPSTPFSSDSRLLFVDLQPDDGPPRCSLPARPRRAYIPIVMPRGTMSRMEETRNVGNKEGKKESSRGAKTSHGWNPGRGTGDPSFPEQVLPLCPRTFRPSPAADPHLWA